MAVWHRARSHRLGAEWRGVSPAHKCGCSSVPQWLHWCSKLGWRGRQLGVTGTR
jgi:hypothetical protein